MDDYEKIITSRQVTRDLKYTLSSGEEIDYTLKFIVLTKGDHHCQLNVSLPFSFKSSWIKTCKRNEEAWVDYANDRLESELDKRYKSIEDRDNKQQQFHKKFKDVVEKEYKEYKEDFHHKYLHETINDKYIGVIGQKIESMPDGPKIKCDLAKDKLKKMLLECTCSYCGVSMIEINQLSEDGKLHTKRSRGYSMEIDQVDPYGFYTDENCLASCYWCNNAKTDEFSPHEFKEIAYGIHKAWNKRLEGMTKIIFPEIWETIN